MLLKIVNSVLGEYIFEGIEGILFRTNIWAIILSTILGFITIYLSAFISAKKASMVNPIQLLRNSADIKIKSNKLKVPSVIQKLFKTGGVLAYKNLKRSKKKYRTTVISIAVSICIFITMNTFINNMFDIGTSYYEDYDYNFKIYCQAEDLNYILGLEGIEEYYTLYQDKNYSYIRIYDKSKVSKEELIIDYEDEAESYMELSVVGLDDGTFKKYVKKIGEDYDKIKDTGILIDDYEDMEEIDGKQVKREERAYNYKVGDVIKGRCGERNTEIVNGEKKVSYIDDKEIDVKVGAITKVRPYGRENNYYYGGYLVVNVDRYKQMDFKLEMVAVQSSNPDNLEENIMKTNNNIRVRNMAKEVKQEKSMVLVLKIFLYGFIGVITLIGVTNIFNTITSNMELRQTEFAMLKSIGMTKKEFNRMINLETIFYGTKSLLYGIALGMLGTFFLYKAFGSENAKFLFPKMAIFISIVSVFILIFIIMKYSLKKINKQNTIETIRNDNI